MRRSHVIMDVTCLGEYMALTKSSKQQQKNHQFPSPSLHTFGRHFSSLGDGVGLCKCSSRGHSGGAVLLADETWQDLVNVKFSFHHGV